MVCLIYKTFLEHTYITYLHVRVLNGFGMWVGGCVVPSKPPNTPSHPQTATWQYPKTYMCIQVLVLVSGFLKFLPRPPATSPHLPMHPETPIHPSIDPTSPVHWPIHLERGGHSDRTNWNKHRIQTKCLSEKFQLCTERWTTDLSFGVLQTLLLFFWRKLWAAPTNTTYLMAPTVVF